MKIYFLIFYFLFFGHSKAEEIIFPYKTEKQCLEKKYKMYQEDSTKTEADFCFHCDSETESVTAQQIWQDISLAINADSYTKPRNSIPKECFLAMASRGAQIFSEDQYVSCKNETDKDFRKGRKSKTYRPCVNEDYIDLVYNSFQEMSYCFDTDRFKQIEFFNLINQESGGILNIKSDKGARCLGQVTGIYVKEINTKIKKKHTDYRNIYKKVIKKCPFLTDHFIDLESITCQSTNDIRSCLFYTFFGLTRNHEIIKKRMKSHPDYMGNKEFPEDTHQSIKNSLPIKRNEMLVIKGMSKNGNKIHWVIWDDSELYGLYKKIDYKQELSIEKVPLFEKEKDIQTMFMLWAHNGGKSMANNVHKQIDDFKKQIAISCEDKKTKLLRCQARAYIKEGKGLSSHFSLKYFEKDILRNYSGGSQTTQKRKKEVSDYISTMIRINAFTFEKREKKETVNEMTEYYNESDLNEEAIYNFQNHVHNVCPRIEGFTKD